MTMQQSYKMFKRLNTAVLNIESLKLCLLLNEVILQSSLKALTDRRKRSKKKTKTCYMYPVFTRLHVKSVLKL